MCVFVFYPRGYGRVGRPAFTAPSILRAAKRFLHNSGKSRRENAESYVKLCPRHCEEQSDEAIHSYFAATWIASRSLSSGAHSRDPLARNDGSIFDYRLAL